MGLGEMGLGEMVLGEMVLGDMDIHHVTYREYGIVIDIGRVCNSF
jgi:hypothetical protein